ncbi:hypothetical protein [Bradyrhizobium sp. SZCCHNRI1073]|uniref:hypothetical protein n=1 Tax=Bradyrhizobium sp. SZCCHNRI1073 TaxID=3057280 RepID=UPI002915FE57|nr:hypothetical protein [Bradyrhizobium sp. SZCCHNRI1073]
MVTAIEAVIKTMTTDVEGSSRLLRRLLEPAHVAEFGHEELRWLAQHIGLIAQADPDLAVAIYEVAYGYEDTDRETPVRMGNSQILAMSTNRRQNYQQAWWTLGQALPALLETQQEVGVRAASRAIGAYVRRARPPISGEPSAGGTFVFGSEEARYLPDRSYSWYRAGFVSPQDGPALFKKFDEYLFAVAARGDGATKITEITETLKAEAGLAVFWASLLLVAAKHPTLAPMMAPLAAAPPVMTGWDTRQPLGQFLSAAYSTLSLAEREAIERSILELSGIGSEDAKKRLAGTLPAEFVATAEMRAYREALAESGGARPNDPIIKMSSSVSAFDTDAYLAAEGVDVDEAANASLLAALKTVEDLPPLTTVNGLNIGDAAGQIAVLEALQQQITAGKGAAVDTKLMELAEGTLAENAAAVVRMNPNVIADDQLRRRLQALLLWVSLSANPHYNPAVEADFNEQLHWGGPSARTSAADGLIRLAGASRILDQDVVLAIQRLARDTVCHVRLHIVRNLNVLARTAETTWMWSELDHVVTAEPTGGVVHGALEAASSLVSVDMGRAIVLAKTVIKRYTYHHEPAMAACNSLAATFIADLHFWSNAPEADEFFDGCLSAASFNPAQAMDWIARYSDNLLAGSPADRDDPKHQFRTKTLAFYNRALDVALTTIETVRGGRSLDTFGAWSESDQARVRAAFDIVDQIALRLSFALGAHAQSATPETDLVVERMRLYFEVKPLLNRLADSPVARIAHNLIQGLEAVISIDPSGVFATIARCIRASARGGYALESLAARLIVGIVERYLAEHRDVFAAPDRLADLIDSLDIFARAGWPEAQALTFRIAEIWR